MDLISLKSFIPEIFLASTSIFYLLFNSMFLNSSSSNYAILNKEAFSQVFFLLLCTFILNLNVAIESYCFNFLLCNDLGSNAVKTLILLTSILALPSIYTAFKIQKLNFFEFFFFYLISVVSLLLLVSVSDMLSAFLIIELQSFCFYILACFKRDSSFSTEAGLKYFILGSFFSGIFLMGCSLIYSVCGTLNFANLNILLTESFFSIINYQIYFILLLGSFLIIVSLLFKVAAFPFHFWAPDVYEGSPLASTVIFSLLPKFSIFYFFLKFISLIDFLTEIKLILLISAIFSILFSSFFALIQKKFKKLIIYSSLAQVGFIIAAISINQANSFITVFFFLIIYIITSILAWSNICAFYSFSSKLDSFEGRQSTPLYISSMSSFFLTHKSWSFVNVIFFFSLAGIPPFVGFLSKFVIVFSLITKIDLLIPLFFLIVSAIGVFYYIRILKIIFFEKSNSIKINLIVFSEDSSFDFLVISSLLFLILYLSLYPSIILNLSSFIYFNSFFS
jgi:NADH-quinone oxidoreductase subunit N